VLGSGPPKKCLSAGAKVMSCDRKAKLHKAAYNRVYPLAAALEVEISHQGLACARNKHSSLDTLHLINKKKGELFKEAKIGYKEIVFRPFPFPCFFPDL